MAATGASGTGIEDGTETRGHLDQQTEMSRERILSVEKAFATATQDMAGVVRQIAKLRNAGDVLVENFAKYADTELPSMRENLQAVCECLAAVEDHRQAHVSRVETQVIHPLTHYEKTCKLAKDGLKDRKPAREKEISKQKVYDKVRRDHPNDTRKIGRALEEMQTARAEAAQVSKKAEEHMRVYELQKLKDAKSIFGDYLMSCMTFHAKSLELCSLAFQNLNGVDKETYLEEFRLAFHRRTAKPGLSQLGVSLADGAAGAGVATQQSTTSAISRSREDLAASGRPAQLTRVLSHEGGRRHSEADTVGQNGVEDDGSDVDEDYLE
ncbi:CBY1-interacting BAR domain-containing protein 1-like isoform X2 [Sycon ciliatum]|uniref:CBY1-interacting BAR domain-containing protein 1-like isoform X2 n=1 Tax=Sycon ciliatum TaxID=27933 RepID=UPI0031F60EF1